MKKSILISGVSLLLGLSACNNDDKRYDFVLEQVVTSDFEINTEDWTADLSEYSTAIDTSSIEFRYGRTSLPGPLDTKTYGYMIQSHNRSDDMFMFLKRKIGGLKANYKYQVTFDIDLATNYPESSIGIGGSPGSSVYLKAGASASEPAKKLVNGFYTFNLDKGAQSASGKDMVVLGNISNSLDTETYKIVKRSNSTPLAVTSDANGMIWVCVGTDSGFEGLTKIYYDKIKVSVTEASTN